MDVMIAGESQQVTMSSREIAELVESRHDKVKQSIERLAERGVITLPPLGEASFTDTAGKTQRTTEYRLEKRDSYVVVAQLSPEFTARLVDRWQELETAAATLVPDLSDPAVLTTLLLEHAGKRIEAERRAVTAERIVEEIKPKARFYDEFAEADGHYGYQNGGRSLGCHPNLFVRWLKKEYVFYQGAELVPYLKYRQMGLFEITVELDRDRKARTRGWITPKGLQYLSTRIPDEIKIRDNN